jgi:predicted nucleic-acid-binding Zn-ribbon protein
VFQNEFGAMTIMRKRTKKIQNKGSFKSAKDKKSKQIVSSKISKFASGFRIPDDDKSKCPKCLSDMMRHPSSVSMPLSSSPDDTNNIRKINIEDQDANFVFKFRSCKNCGYSEFYLHNKGSGTRV